MGINSEYGYSKRFDHVTSIRERSSIRAVSCEAHLIVSDEMDSAAARELGQFAQSQCFISSTLTCESSITMPLDIKYFLPSAEVVLFSFSFTHGDRVLGL